MLFEAPIPVDEEERIAALHMLHLLDTPPEERFQRLITLARQQFYVPIALLSLVDTNRLWFKACAGITVSHGPRNTSFCQYTILQDECLVIPDTRQDARFTNNAVVAGPPFVRFHAGYPLRAPGGYKVGTFCILDLLPRQLSSFDCERLRNLALLAQRELRTGPGK